jgi:hypothetical protein
LNLQQITDAVHTTCYFGVIHALLGGKSYYREWRRKFGRQVARKNDLFREERKRWAIVQKSKDGLYVLDAELKHELKREGVTPNLWVFPDKMGIYINMVSGDALSYEKHGPEAKSNRDGGDRVATFRGLPVFEAQSFDVEFTSEPVDLLIRERMCGEYFLLESGKEIAIYSADSDKFEKIAHKNVKDKETTHVFGTGAGNERQNGTAENTKLGSAAAGSEAYLLFRPFQTYRMASAILARGGQELGATYHGHHDFMLSDDILRKVHVGHYTFYSKSVVKRPKNYIIIEDCFAQGYVGGEGIGLFSKGTDADSLSQGIANGTLGKSGPSIIAVKYKGLQEPADCIDITGRFHQSVYDQFDDGENYVEHYKGSGQAYSEMQLDALEAYRKNESDEYMQRIQRYNTVCFRGMRKQRDTGSGADFKLVQLNTGHWGPNVYAGCRKVRDGENTFLHDMEYQKQVVQI